MRDYEIRRYEMMICVRGFAIGPWYKMPWYWLCFVWDAIRDIEVERVK